MASMHEVLAALAVGLVPGVEPRYVVPLLARLTGLKPAAVMASVEVVLLSLLLATVVDRLSALMDSIGGRLGFIGRVYLSARRRVEGKRRLVERYGVVGLAAFVAVPLPLTGVYTGALLALLTGLGRWRTFLALAAGGLASVLLVTAASLGVFRVVEAG